MIRFLLRRLFWAIFMFVAGTMITFAIFYIAPRDPAALIPGGSEYSVSGQRIYLAFHFDVPIYQQYWIFLWNIIRHGSLGYSFSHGASVRSILAEDAPITASLVLGGAVFWLLLAVPIGIVSALRPRSLLDRAGMTFVLVGISVPSVWIGMILAYVFGFRLGWTPIADYCPFFPKHGLCSGPAHWAYHLILPWMTFMLVFAAIYTRMIRANMLETLSEDYVRTALAKGAAGRQLLVHHVLRNSLLPVLTMLGMDLGLAITGAVFTETVFNLNGLGGELVRAANPPVDLPVIVGIVVAITLVVVVLNFFVDVAYAFLDPRVRLRA